MNTIETFAKQFQLSQEETEIVRQAYYLEHGATMTGVIPIIMRNRNQKWYRTLPISGKFETINGF